MKRILVSVLCAGMAAQLFAYNSVPTQTDTTSVPTLMETARDSLGNAQDHSFIDSIKVSIIRGELPQVKLVDGSLSIDLPEIVKDRPVTNIYDALAYVPGVSKSSTGDLSLIGAEGFTILINGKLPTMPDENLVDLLQSYPVDRLKNVEVHYSTPAKYHVNGASINIILKEASPLDGLQGQVSANYRWKHFSTGGAGIAGTYAGGKWSVDLVYNFTGGKSWENDKSYSDHTLSDGSNTYIEQTDQITTKSRKYNGHAGFNFDLGRDNRLSASYDFQFRPVPYSSSVSEGALGSYYTYNTYPPSQFHSATLDYTSSFGLSLGLTYTNYREHADRSLTDITDSEAPVQLQNYTSDQRVQRWHAYADQVHHIGSWELSYGASFDHSRDYGSQAYENDPDSDFATSLKEYSADLYVGFATSFANGISLSASVKGDYYNRGDERKLWIAPQISFAYMKNPNHILQLNVSTDEDYPSYWAMQTTKSWLNNYAVVEGNPLLRPEYDYTVQAAYILKQKYMVSLYYSYADGYNVQIPYQSPDEFTLIYKVLNFDWQQKIGLMIRVPFRIGDVLNSTLTLNGYYARVKSDDFYGMSVLRAKPSFYADWNNSIKLSRNHPVYLTVEGTVFTPSLQAIMDVGTLWKIDAGFKWTFLKGAADLVVSGVDLANTWTPLLKNTRFGQNYRMRVFDMTRSVSVSFVYRFNGFKPKSFKVDSSRFGI